ncbi:hypothetical protein PRIPAC_79411 [Pristionchus pacificus]|uniref:glucuronosyltransferase n=1 Tax=Pristionchus pacificus TaxID=54126 RepID=A0A8R1U9J7_PRIPA|nr:hypothetical protein PRIPAC_79411 [Pristionchus pacificus]
MKNSYSHANFIGRLSDVLVEGGLNVTTLISEVRTTISDGTSKSHIVRVEPQEEAYRLWNTGEMPPIFDGSSHDLRSILSFVPHLREVFLLQCRHLLTKTEMIEQLRREEYDAVIGETFDYCGFGLAKIIGAKTVIATFSSSLNDYTAWITGTPSPWAVTQASYSGVLDRSISSRLWNLLAVGVDYYVNWRWAGAANDAFRERFGNDFPSVEEMVANSSLIITAGDPLLDLARPTQRKIVDIGAIGIRDANPIDAEYDAILNLRPKTVLFSMGSVARSASLFPEYKAALAETFKQFPDVTFIWKYEEPDNAPHVAGLDNVILRKWIPQNDLLGDPRVSALITHGGKTSLNEVGAKGLPAVFIPIYGDQTKNAAIAVKLGFGVFLNKLDLANAHLIEEAIRAILYDEKYSIAAKRVAATIKDRPFTATELLVKHVKFAARYGNVKSLDMEGYDYPLYIYWNLDILLLVLMIPLISILMLGWCILRSSSQSTIVNKEKMKQN